MTRRPYGPCTSPNRVGVGIADGMGKETGCPSIMGLGQPPAALSKPFRLKTIFNFALVWFTASRGLGHRLGLPANSPSIVAPQVFLRDRDALVTCPRIGPLERLACCLQQSLSGGHPCRRRLLPKCPMGAHRFVLDLPRLRWSAVPPPRTRTCTD